MLYAGLTGGYPIPFYPAPLTHITKLANVSCLFTHSVNDWLWSYVQVQSHPGAAWSTEPEDDYFHMKAFGFHSRLDEVLRRRFGDQSILELTDWLRKRYVELHPNAPAPSAVRIMGVFYHVGQPIPEGHWRKPSLESVDERHRVMLYERTFEEPSEAIPYER